MASKALNAANLEALGTTRLARLLIEISEGNAPVKRRLRLELAGADSPTAVANQIRKRIATIARSRSFVDWHNRKSLVDDLEAQRRANVEQVATRLPTDALDLMWRFVDLAESIFCTLRRQQRSGDQCIPFRRRRPWCHRHLSQTAP